MKEKYYYCYSTNDKELGKYAKKAIKNIKTGKKLHEATSIIATIQSVMSLLIDAGNSKINLEIEKPYIGNKLIASKAYVILSAKPLKEYTEDLIDEKYLFKKVTNEIEHDDFSLFEEKLYGKIIKYTSFIHLENIELKNKKEYNKKLTELIIPLLNYIKQGNIKRESKFQIPIGQQLFNIKMNATIIYD